MDSQDSAMESEKAPKTRQDNNKDVAEEAGDVLYNLACECEALFDARLAELEGQQSPVAELLTEYQQRFAIWAAYLGVFARKSQSLDKRLENYPDVADLAALLLDVLRSNLAQLQGPRPSAEPEVEDHDDQHTRDAALAALEATLPRLNRLGVTIRQASRGKFVVKSQKFAADVDQTSFTDASRFWVQVLYPECHPSLREYLAKTMTARYISILYQAHRTEKLQARRPTRPSDKLPIIGEGEALFQQPPLRPVRHAQAEPGRASHVSERQPVARSTISQSDLSSITSSTQFRQQIARGNYLTAPTERRGGTSSIQVSQGNYPSLRVQKNTHLAPCQWCGVLVDKRKMTENDWRRHTDEDLKTYPCLSEECPDGHPAHPSFDAWFHHMKSHSPMWHQRVYLTPRCVRVCPVCENNRDVYTTAEELHRHLTNAHGGMFDASKLHVIAQGSKVERPRAWNECLLCGYPVEEVAKTPPPKRQKRQLSLDNNKRSKAGLELPGPGVPRKLEDCPSTSDDSLGAENKPALDDAKTMARHIAGHLQTLMLLTTRLASLQKEEDGDEGGDADSGAAELDDASDAKLDDASDATRALNPKKLFAPVSARIPRYSFANDKYWFVIEAKLEDGRTWELSRCYEDFYDFQIALLTEFPVEAGTSSISSERTLPYMPGPVNYVTEAITEGRRNNLDAYLNDLLALPPHIARCTLVKLFFGPREADYEIHRDAVDEDERLSAGSRLSLADDDPTWRPRGSRTNPTGVSARDGDDSDFWRDIFANSALDVSRAEKSFDPWADETLMALRANSSQQRPINESDNIVDNLDVNGKQKLPFISLPRKEAKKNKAEVPAPRHDLLGGVHPGIIDEMADAAMKYHAQGRYDEAEEMYAQVLALRRDVLGSQHPDTIRAIADVAMSYHAQGRYDEAEEMYAQVLALRRDVLGSRHPDTMKAMADVAMTCHAQGRYDEAKSIYMEVLALRHDVLGEMHPDTIRSMADLASTYHAQGKYDEAEKLYMEVLTLRRNTLSERHPETLQAMHDLAITWNNGQRHLEALAMMKECFQLQSEVLGPTHSATIRSSDLLRSWGGAKEKGSRLSRIFERITGFGR